MTSIAEQIPPAFVERFKILTAIGDCNGVSYGCGEIGCDDPNALGALLADVCSHLAGVDWFSEPAIEEACHEAGLDFDELRLVPPSAADHAAEDLERKEIGDLGELLAVLHLLAHH